MSEPLEGDGLSVRRCEGCGGLSLIILCHGEPIAYVCLPDDVFSQLVKISPPLGETVQ